ncbi:MAG: hypothetical protein WCH39_14760 [Schlesneria sp.]
MTAEPNPISKEQDLSKAQLKQVELQNEKLELELANMRGRKPWYAGLIELLPIISTLLTIAGFWGGIWQYLHQENLHNLDRKKTAEQEFMKPWLENQRSIYTEALSAATEVAYATTP